MASAVDSRLAYARPSAVATASRLPTATRDSNNSYTTSWDTTYEAVRPAVVNEGLSHREAARQFGIDRRTVKKMLSYSAPLGSVRARPIVPQKGFSGTRAMLEKAAGSRALSQVMC